MQSLIARHDTCSGRSGFDLSGNIDAMLRLRSGNQASSCFRIYKCSYGWRRCWIFRFRRFSGQRSFHQQCRLWSMERGRTRPLTRICDRSKHHEIRIWARASDNILELSRSLLYFCMLCTLGTIQGHHITTPHATQHPSGLSGLFLPQKIGTYSISACQFLNPLVLLP